MYYKNVCIVYLIEELIMKYKCLKFVFHVIEHFSLKYEWH